MAVTRQNGYDSEPTFRVHEFANAIRSRVRDWLSSLGVATVAFVDGLSLYHGMRDDGLLKFRWLDNEPRFSCSSPATPT